ncbi:MAG: hypothetical protein Q9195_007095 [Heterodermia aff. obscurata]
MSLEGVLLNSTTLRSGEIQCNDQRLGRGLNKRSCWNAWDKMPRSPSQHEMLPRFVGRHGGFPTLSKLPIRYLSDDGLCAIDVRLPAGSKGDTTTDRAIAGAARSVLFECVEDHGSGGQLGIPSSKHEIFVVVSKYEPAVNCDPGPAQSPSFESCNQLLQSMPATLTAAQFSTDRAEATSGCTLPREIYAHWAFPPPRCKALVDMPGGVATKETYFNIYAGERLLVASMSQAHVELLEAGVAVNVICVQHGMTGRAFHLGRNGGITLSLDAAGH